MGWAKYEEDNREIMEERWAYRAYAGPTVRSVNTPYRSNVRVLDESLLRMPIQNANKKKYFANKR